MSRPDDELPRLLRQLRDAEPPPASSVDDVVRDVRRRVVHRQQRNRTAAAALAAAAAVALVVVPGRLASGPGPGDTLASEPGGSLAPGSPSPTKSPGAKRSTGPAESPKPKPSVSAKPAGQATVGPRPAAATVLGCPTTWAGPADSAWVPEEPPSLASDTLLPSGAVRLAVCGYPATTTGHQALGTSASVHGGFTDMVSTLSTDPAGDLAWCPDAAGAEDFLIRADYSDGSHVWIAATSGSNCAGATNGVFTTAGSFAAKLAVVLDESGTWGGPYPGDCAVTDARGGRSDAMVPSTPAEAFVCVTDPGSGQRDQVHLTDGARVGRLATLLNGLSAAAGAPSCPDASGTTYLVNFRYAGAEDVSVRVVPDCETGAFNGELTAPPSEGLVAELEQSTRG